MNDDIAISVKGVSKNFRLPHEKVTSIKSGVVNVFRKKSKKVEVQHALKNVSFDIKKGEFFGIVGRNGSGKSTLLKTISGIYRPDKGSVQVNGSLVPFIELGVGFNPELTGRENVYLNGALLGFSKKQIDAMYDDIVEFAELERFMDQKLKNYSSGMQVRLAFSVAIKAQGDILVLDEVLAVGDAAFQQKCNDYFMTLKKEKHTVVLVTHDMAAVERYCDKAVLVRDGVLEMVGNPKEISKHYTIENQEASQSDDAQNKKLSDTVKNLNLKITSPKVLDNKNTLEFEVEYELNEDVPVYAGLSILYQGMSIMEHNSLSIDLPHTKHVRHKLVYSLPLDAFHSADLSLDIAMFKKATAELIGYKLAAGRFSVRNSEKHMARVMSASGVWKSKK